jgi:hypothetical protein
MEVDSPSPSSVSRSASVAAPLPPPQPEVCIFIPPSRPTHFNATDDFTYAYGAGGMLSMDTGEIVNLLDEASDLASAGQPVPFADFADFLATVHKPVRLWHFFYLSYFPSNVLISLLSG